jgi:predicted PurR-regulated permease PerM
MSNQKPTEISVSNRTIVRIIALIVITYMGIQFLLTISNILTLIAASAFLALALNPAVTWIRRHLKIKSRAAATGIAYITVITIFIGFFAIIVPPLFSQTSKFVTSVPNTVENLNDQNSTAGKIIQRYQLEDTVGSISRDLRNRASDFPKPLLSTATRVGSTIASVVAVLFMTFMMIVEGPMWIERFWRLQSKSRRERGQRLVNQMYQAVTNYVNGQLLIAVIGASFALVVMLIASTILNVSINAVGLAGIVALTGLIPMIGNTIGAVIVVTVCMLVSLPLAIIMGIFFLLYQQIENVSIQPYIQSKKNELTPLLVFVAALVGISFAGLLGGFVAIPLASCLKILFNDYYKTRTEKNT